MKSQTKISILALSAAMMWSGLASAAILSNTSKPSAPSPGAVLTSSGVSLNPLSNTTTPGGAPGIYRQPGSTNPPADINLVSVVSEGCAMPKLLATRHAFYVDPIHGSTMGDGSAAHPWHTLSEVVSKNLIASVTHPNAPVKAGDVVYLMSGNHGAVAIQNIHNSDFITIEAVPGQMPVLDYLAMGNVEKFLIHGLKLQSIKTGISSDWHPLLTISASLGTSKDIIIDGNLVSSQDDVSGWTQADWIAKARAGFYTDGRTPMAAPTAGVTCTTITNNTFTHVMGGVGIRTDHTLFAGNIINDFANDAFDYAANDLVISNNVITNSEVMGNGAHTDAMQGQVNKGPGYSTELQKYKNVSITGNLVVSQTDPKLKYPNPGFQGIDAFDSDWTNLSVTNNTVIVTAYHGISYASVHNALIANNTVLPAGPLPTWIDASSKTHEGLPSDNVVVRNNLATNYISDMDIGIMHNNIVGRLATHVDGVAKWFHTPGVYGDNNVIVPNFLQGFVRFDNVHFAYDLHWAVGAPFKAGYGSTIPVVINNK